MYRGLLSDIKYPLCSPPLAVTSSVPAAVVRAFLEQLSSLCNTSSADAMDCDTMENDILEALEDLGYKGSLMDEGALIPAATQGALSPEYTKLCAWLVAELRLFCKLEENVEATNSPAEAEGFQLEMSGLLTEMICPYVCLTSGDVSKRLLDKTNCLLLLTYLISELEAARMLCVNIPAKQELDGGSEVFKELKTVCMSLGMSKPPANITMFQFFSGIEKKVKETLAKVPPNHMGKPLLSKTLGPSHWEKIEAINQAIANEYEVRRKMLVKRLEVTVQSFGWSDRAKNQSEKLAKVYQPKRAALSSKSSITVAHLLAARHDLSKILRTSSGSIREKTACAINKILMGRVPDRGGRPNEIEPPPPEMPPWQKRQDGPPQGGRGGGRGGYEQSYSGRGGYEHGGGRGGYEHGGGRGGYEHGGGRGSYEHGGGRGGYEHGGGRGGYESGGRGGGRGGYDQGGNRGGRGNKVQGGWTDGGSSNTGHYQDSGYRDSGIQTGGYQGGGGHQGGGYQGGGYSGYQGSSYSGGGFQGGGYQQDNRYQDGGHQNDRGGGRAGGRGGRVSRGGRGGQGGGWGGRGAQSYNQGGQFEQHFQHGGYQYNQSGFGQGRHYTT
ncbi:protein FAM98A [Rhinoderma darwinii]|uniref:protein FAM98A n=1 Tax=Rhinoderma darwinii TaxID=43563 RepID=UPI003F67CD25